MSCLSNVDQSVHFSFALLRTSEYSALLSPPYLSNIFWRLFVENIDDILPPVATGLATAHCLTGSIGADCIGVDELDTDGLLAVPLLVLALYSGGEKDWYGFSVPSGLVIVGAVRSTVTVQSGLVTAPVLAYFIVLGPVFPFWAFARAYFFEVAIL